MANRAYVVLTVILLDQRDRPSISAAVPNSTFTLLRHSADGTITTCLFTCCVFRNLSIATVHLQSETRVATGGDLNPAKDDLRRIQADEPRLLFASRGGATTSTANSGDRFGASQFSMREGGPQLRIRC